MSDNALQYEITALREMVREKDHQILDLRLIVSTLYRLGAKEPIPTTFNIERVLKDLRLR